MLSGTVTDTSQKRTAATVVNGKIDSDKAKTAASKKTAVKTAAKKATTTKATVVKKPTAPKTTNTTAPKKAAPLKKASAAVKAPVEKVVENANTVSPRHYERFRAVLKPHSETQERKCSQ